MKRFAILISLILLHSFSVTAQIQESVVIVKPQLSDESVAMYQSISDHFRDQNLTDIADYFDGLAEGGFGSGYITEGPNGQTIVVTCGHVVTCAESVSITQLNENREEVSITGCPIIYEDAYVDLALISVPTDKFSDSLKLDLAGSVPKDGETVWSAGYPSLFGKPSWQLAEGVVTNRRVVVETLGLPEHAVFTQHSAPIDPGNSGGPLLTGRPSDPSSFRVVGINTWIALGRQSSNFAISLDMLHQASGRYMESTGELDPAVAVRKKAEDLLSTFNQHEWSRFEAKQYISSYLVAKQGWDAVRMLISSLNPYESPEWAERFFGESPVETMRQAILYMLYKDLSRYGQSVELTGVQQLTAAKEKKIYRTSLTSGPTTYLVDWCNEAGMWRISQFVVPSAGSPRPKQLLVRKKRAEREKMPPEGYPFPTGFTFGFGLSSIPTIYGWEYGFSEEIGYHFGLGRIASVGGCFVLDEGASLVEFGNQSTLLIIGIEAQGRVGIPIQLKYSMLFPYLGAGILGGLAPSWEDTGRWRASLQAEVGIMLRSSSKWSIGVSAGPSFATDNQVRLESIAARFLLLYSPGENRSNN